MAKRKRFDDLLLLAAGELVVSPSTRYSVDKVVGSGSFGAVYSSKDLSLPDRRVALKEFFPARHPREQASLRALFERESKVGRQASAHPLMPTFYEAFEADKHFYIAQEFIEGASLNEIVVRRHPLPREWILKWAVSLCDALAFLHSRNVVHHDLKPDNIRITPQGHLKLLDFGAAQYFGDDQDENPKMDLYGTEGYLPPELEMDGNWVADARTDIFALGCIIYELIAGEPPDQEKINERSMYVTNSLINRPNADLGLVKLINKALSYNTDYRYGSANDFLLDIRKIAPPALLVDKKHLRFGRVQAGHPSPTLKVVLYNAGGGEMRGEVKPRSPWIQVSSTTFTGNHREVGVKLNTAKIDTRDQLLTGRLEINMIDQLDDEGNVQNAGDRWFVECSVIVLPRAGHVEIAYPIAQKEPGIQLTGRKGQKISSPIELRNVGEQQVGFKLVADGALPTDGGGQSVVTATPESGSIDPGGKQRVVVEADAITVTAGQHTLRLLMHTDTNQFVTIPVSVRVQSAMDYWKSRLGKRE